MIHPIILFGYLHFRCLCNFVAFDEISNVFSQLLNSDLKMIDTDISNLYPNYIKTEIFQSEEPLTLEANSKIDFFDIPCKMYDGYVPVMASLLYARNDYVISRGCNIRYESDNIYYVRLFPTNFASVEVTCYPMVNVLYIKGNKS